MYVVDMVNNVRVLAIDPGTRGGFVVVDKKLDVLEAFSFVDKEDKDIHQGISLALARYSPEVVMERVGPMRGQGVASTWTFARGVGFIQGVVNAFGWDNIIYVSPQKWQKMFLGGERFEKKTDRKNRLKDKAKELFPTTKVTLAIADALLLAYWYIKK